MSSKPKEKKDKIVAGEVGTGIGATEPSKPAASTGASEAAQADDSIIAAYQADGFYHVIDLTEGRKCLMNPVGQRISPISSEEADIREMNRKGDRFNSLDPEIAERRRQREAAARLKDRQQGSLGQ